MKNLTQSVAPFASAWNLTAMPLGLDGSVHSGWSDDTDADGAVVYAYSASASADAAEAQADVIREAYAEAEAMRHASGTDGSPYFDVRQAGESWRITKSISGKVISDTVQAFDSWGMDGLDVALQLTGHATRSREWSYEMGPDALILTIYQPNGEAHTFAVSAVD